ncbi:MAG: efflux RND transporter periplasmic adaptor subunit [Bacteroidaceae bacterium]|nr:efflux RND transporter periplasmic adaptor subunit [Bacteroidaceae bacterium]
MKKIFKWFLIVSAIVVFAGTFVFLYQKSRPKEKVYHVLPVTKMDLEKKTIVNGKIEPRDEVSIKPQISGIITELFKEAGQPVKKDEVIAKVKVIPDMGNLSAAEYRVRQAEVNMNQAQTDYDRMNRLYEQKVVSAENYEKQAVAYRQAQLELSSARDALNIVREGISLSNASMSTTLIRSTIDGLILDVPVKVGNSVILSNSFNDGTTIATVADMGNLIFRGQIDETEVGRISEGIPVNISVGALPDVRLNATLEYISPKGVEQNGANQFEIKAAISLPEGITIRSGYSANAEIVLERAQQCLSIPEAALEFSGDTTFVHVLKDSVPVQRYERIRVVTGLSDGVNIQVCEGVKDGQQVRGMIKE